MENVTTIEKLSSIILFIDSFTEEDIQNLVEARDRILQSNTELDEKDTIGITRIDSILAIYSTLEK